MKAPKHDHYGPMSPSRDTDVVPPAAVIAGCLLIAAGMILLAIMWGVVR